MTSAVEATLPDSVATDTTDADILARIVVRCMVCEARFTGADVLAQCPICGGLLDVVIPTKRQTYADRPRRGYRPPAARHSGVWRYLPLLPALPEAALVSRWEGNTPLYRDDRLARYAGLPDGHLELKHEGHNPTASFKDRGMTVGVSHAKAVGARIVACASTGNTSASLAAYAAAAGIPALVLVPETKVAAGKLAQTIAYGAKVVQVDGDFDVALALLRELTAAYDVYLVNSVNPFRLEGQKTIVFEMLEQRGWQPPDWIVLPGGNLGNTSAFGKALTELHAVGLIDRLPRLAVDPGCRRGAVRRLPCIRFRGFRPGPCRDGRHRDQDRQSGLDSPRPALDRAQQRLGDHRRPTMRSSTLKPPSTAAVSAASRRRPPRWRGCAASCETASSVRRKPRSHS